MKEREERGREGREFMEPVGAGADELAGERARARPLPGPAEPGQPLGAPGVQRKNSRVG